jgi:hypothetical protein
VVNIGVMDDNLLDEIIALKYRFDSNGKQATSKRVSELRQSYPHEWVQKCRREYLDTISDDIRFELLIENLRLEKYTSEKRELKALLVKETIKELSHRLDKIEKEIYFTENPTEDNSEKVRMAKEVPFDNFLEFNKFGQAVCPFHGDTAPSMKLYGNNTVHCFSCHKSWDTIQFVRELYNLGFKEAIAKCLASV